MKCECGSIAMRVMFGQHEFEYYVCCNPFCKKEIKTDDPREPKKDAQGRE
jgi:hypothetical protein